MTRHRYDSATPEAPSIASLPVTAQLLLACAHARLGERESARVRELAAGQIDWDCLLELAGQHAVVALLYQSLRAAAADVAPATVIEQLRAAFHASTQHSLMQTGELLRLAHTLAEAQIPMIALKGPTLATMAYGSLALRSSVDLDILVRKADLERAMALLRSQGYQQLEQLGEAQVDAYIEAQHHFSFVRESLLVELHYELGERYFEVQIDTDQLWEHAAPVALAGHTVSALSYTDQLTTLCIHGLRHCWERLAWVCDIAELLRQERELDWPALLAEQQARGTERLLLLGVYLAHRLLAAPLPASVVMRAERDPAVPGLAHQVTRALFVSGTAERGIIESARFHLRARERWHDRLRYCLRLALSPTLGDWSLTALPRPLTFLYYAIRPFRLAGTYGAAWLQGVYSAKQKAKQFKAGPKAG